MLITLQAGEPAVHYFHGGVNCGIVVAQGQAVLVDTGLDKDSGKALLKIIKALGAVLTGIVITHAHADHFGGAAYLVRQTNAPLYAPALEAAVITAPLLEPLYLFAGAEPPRELKHKFTLAKECPVKEVIIPGPLQIGPISLMVVPLPGHSSNQVGYGVRDTLFCGDTFFTSDILCKHRIPFFVQIDQALASLAYLKGAPFRSFVPGHGDHCEDIAPSVEENGALLTELREMVFHACASPTTPAQILQAACAHTQASIQSIPQHSLLFTTIQACLSSLYAAGRVAPMFQDSVLYWQQVTQSGTP